MELSFFTLLPLPLQVGTVYGGALLINQQGRSPSPPFKEHVFLLIGALRQVAMQTLHPCFCRNRQNFLTHGPVAWAVLPASDRPVI